MQIPLSVENIEHSFVPTGNIIVSFTLSCLKSGVENSSICHTMYSYDPVYIEHIFCIRLFEILYVVWNYNFYIFFFFWIWVNAAVGSSYNSSTIPFSKFGTAPGIIRVLSAVIVNLQQIFFAPMVSDLGFLWKALINIVEIAGWKFAVDFESGFSELTWRCWPNGNVSKSSTSLGTLVATWRLGGLLVCCNEASATKIHIGK